MDELAPLFESRDTRLGRLPEQARNRLKSIADASPDDSELVDRQFVSVWLSRKTGIPRKDVLANFDAIRNRLFGEGTTAQAYNTLSAQYKASLAPAGQDTQDSQQASPSGQDGQEKEHADTEGFLPVAKGWLGQAVRELPRLAGSGVSSSGDQAVAGFYSQIAAATDKPLFRSLSEHPEWVKLTAERERLSPLEMGTSTFQFAPSPVTSLFGFTATSPEENRLRFSQGAQADRLDRLNEIELRRSAIVEEVNRQNLEALANYAGSFKEAFSKEARANANFWTELAAETDASYGADPEFAKTTIGQFAKSAGSLPATAVMAALGPGGWVALESMMFAQEEETRKAAEGDAYVPRKALLENMAVAVPQTVMERALGVERLLNKVLKEIPKTGGKIMFGDYVKRIAHASLRSGAEESVEEMSQGAWGDFMASITYDEKREVLTGEGAKRRLIEGVSAFVLGAMGGGMVQSAVSVDQHRATKKVIGYLDSKDGSPLAPQEFTLLRSVKTDEQIKAMAPDAATGNLLLAAANGDVQAQKDYNRKAIDALFIDTEGIEVAGITLGTIDGKPVYRDKDGMAFVLDMSNPEHVRFVNNVKREAADIIRRKSLEETAAFLEKGLEPGRTLDVSEGLDPNAKPKTLQDFIDEGRQTIEEAAASIGIARDVNGAQLAEGINPQDVRVLGVNFVEYENNVAKNVSKVFAGGNSLTVLEEVGEGYLKARLAAGDLSPDEITAWRKAYEQDTGTATTTSGSQSDTEWFSKRVVDYAVSNRKALGLPKSLDSFFRVLGEHLRVVFRLAQRMAKLQRDGKLSKDFESHLQAAIGAKTQAAISEDKRQEARAQRQADLEAAFPPLDSNEDFRSSALAYMRLKEQLALEAKQASEADLRATDFIRARMEEALQEMIDSQLGGDESYTLADKLTPEQKWTLRAVRQAQVGGLTVELSPQAQAMLEQEGYDEQGAQPKRATPVQTTRDYRVSKPTAEEEAAIIAKEAEAFTEPTDFDTVALEELEAAQFLEDFPIVREDGSEWIVEDSGTKKELGRTKSKEAAFRLAGVSFEEKMRGEEKEVIANVHKMDAGVSRLLTDIVRLGGLISPKDSGVFQGELRAIADGLPANLRLKLFRKKVATEKQKAKSELANKASGSRKGAGAMDLDRLREALEGEGYPYVDINDLLVDLDKATQLLAEEQAKRQGDGYVTFSLAPREPKPPGQTDMFGGGETGGDVLFNLQGEEAQDHTGAIDRLADSREAKKRAASDQEEMTFALTGVPQTRGQALQAQAQALKAKSLAETGRLIAMQNAGMTIPDRVERVMRSHEASLAARALVPISTRLLAISKPLASLVRRHDFRLGRAILKDSEAITGFLKGFKGMSADHARVMDLALKNGDTVTRDALLNAYNLTAQFAKVTATLDSIRQRALAAGMEVGFIDDYFPRNILDIDGLFHHYGKDPLGGILEEAIAKATKVAIDAGRSGLTHSEKIRVMNNALQGQLRGTSKPGNTKARATPIVQVEADKFYADSSAALVGYINAMNTAIEKRVFFGKDAKNLQGPVGGGMSGLNLDSSIGALVEGMIDAGELTRAQQEEVKQIIEARFSEQMTGNFIKAVKTLGYITTMGKVTSALTQINDLVWSLYENGFFESTVALGKAVTKNAAITREAIGIERIAEEFSDLGKMAKALQLTFKMTGLTYIDAIGKETLVNAKFAQLQKQAQSGQLNKRNVALLNRVFKPADIPGVLADLKAGKQTEDTLFAVYNILADYQPIAASEYPESYLRHPNGRVFYMLKTFTLRQIDTFRREAITRIVSGNAKQKVEGFRNLVHLAGLFMLIGMPVDWIKDFIMGREPRLTDIAIDNLFKMVAISRWNLWRFRDHKDPVRAALELVAPPAPFLAYPIADVFDAATQVSKGEEIKVGEFESWKIIPFGGDPFYWYLGGGKTKIEKRRKKQLNLGNRR